MEKGAWSLTGTRLLGKIGLLARVLVKTMAMTSIQVFHLRRHHDQNLDQGSNFSSKINVLGVVTDFEIFQYYFGTFTQTICRSINWKCYF
jgi:hypothetical protein